MKNLKTLSLNNNSGFTFVEILVVVIIASLLILFMQQLFSHTVKSTMRGQDSFDSYRAATRLFSALRDDLMASTGYQTGENITWGLATTELPAGTAFSNIIEISHETATITYSLVDVSGARHIERVKQEIGGSTENRSFGIPRIQAFEVLRIDAENRLAGHTTSAEQLLINVSVQSADPRFPSARIDFSSLFFPERRAHEWIDWNFVNL